MQPRLKTIELNHNFISAVLPLSVLPLSLEHFGSEGPSGHGERCLLPAMP